MNLATIHLNPVQFTEKEVALLAYGELAASVFRFPSGVCAVRLSNGMGELVLLPFQGQQIWSAEMVGRELTMVHMFDQPYPVRTFLDTYGAFLVHCGATAMGVPGPGDSHPLHGDLPNAPYQSAFIAVGEDEDGEYLALGGSYRHTVAFKHNYMAQPVVRLCAGSSVFHVQQSITNLKNSAMPLMYLAHVNYRPVDNGQLIYSALCDPAHVRVRADVPPFIDVDSAYREFVMDLRERPEKLMMLRQGLRFDPEVVFALDFLSDSEGWAHALQVHPDGSADVVRHRPDQLNHALGWICRTPDQDAVGFEPSTAEGSGFASEMEKGNVRFLQPGEVIHCDIQAGVLSAESAAKEIALVARIVGAQHRM